MEDNTKKLLVGAITVHKSGTNLLSQLFLNMGYKVIGKGINKTKYKEEKISWKDREKKQLDNIKSHTVYFTHLLPVKVGDDIEHRPLLEMWMKDSFPLIFLYRDPRDVLLSFMNYVMNNTASREFSKTPFTYVYSSMFKGIDNKDDRITAAIMCLDDYFNRSFRDHLWLIYHPNILSVSYEDLVGANGGGNDEIQRIVIQSIAQKIGAQKSYHELSSGIYNKNSRTFFKGKIGAYKDEFSETNKILFKEKYGDILKSYGYENI